MPLIFINNFKNWNEECCLFELFIIIQTVRENTWINRKKCFFSNSQSQFKTFTFYLWVRLLFFFNSLNFLCIASLLIINTSNMFLQQLNIYLMTSKLQKMQTLLLNNPALKEAQQRLHSHPIYHSLSTVDDLKLFMERHCWAVWDFFQLIKDLQRDLTNTKRFWTPCVDVQAARFINEIVIGEETDETDNPNEYLSHFELYLRAMEEVGANTKPVREFVKRVSQLGDNQNTLGDISKLIQENQSAQYVKNFNKNTCAAIFLSIPYTAGQFFFGREDPIPQMFTKLVKTVEDNKLECKTLKYYLNRHIELDGSFHGPKTSHLLLCLSEKHDPEYKDILEGALNAIEYRIKLWDGILGEINQRKSK